MSTEEKEILEDRQGEVLESVQSTDAATSKKLYIESYGCQMNFSDSEVVASIMTENGFSTRLVLRKKFSTGKRPSLIKSSTNKDRILLKVTLYSKDLSLFLEKFLLVYDNKLRQKMFSSFKVSNNLVA